MRKEKGASTHASPMYMGVVRGLGPRWILTFLAKKDWFLRFQWEKTNFTTFFPTPMSV